MYKNYIICNSYVIIILVLNELTMYNNLMEIIRMRLYIFALLSVFVFNAAIDNAFAQVDMCTSVQEHIKKANSMGGDKRARLKITQIFEARNYLKKSITEAELVRCVFLSGINPDFIISEAVKSGIPKQTVQAVYVQYNMSLPPDKRASISLVSPFVPEEKKSAPVEETGDALTMDIIAKDSYVEGGVSSGPGCNQISPWTWCAY